jgi:1-acyl-sn-glycerol-3-phosphate acyltransferase
MEVLRRRLASCGGLFAAAVVLLVLVPVWLPLAALVDLLRGKLRFPLARLLLFALGWAWLESAGVLVAASLWLGGQRRNAGAHYRLQRWWAASLVRWLRLSTGLRIETEGTDAFHPGPTVLLCRHASLADSLVSAWAITSVARLRPRYVLKRELLADPCLDVVGNRLPNHFLDREAADSSVELAALTELASGMGEHDVAVIFPEGTRSSHAKRERALRRIAERDPSRIERVERLRHLLPPRPAGAAALLAGAPEADVVLGWHVGFDGLDTFGGIVRHLGRTPPPVRFVTRRVPRAEVPDGDAFTAWLDHTWLELDAAVHEMLQPDPPAAAGI